MSHHLSFATILLACSWTAAAFAQDAEAGASASLTGAGATTDADAGAETGRDDKGASTFDPFEVGLYGGLMFLSKRSNTPTVSGIDKSDLGAAGFDAGLRLGVYPIKYLGLEGELGGVLTRTSDHVGANLGAARVQVVAQYPLETLTPFLLIGGGALGGECDPTGCDGVARGRDADGEFHFGVGVKLKVIDHVHARFDLRDNLVTGDHLPSILGGVAYTFGGHTEAPPPAPSDRDGDGLQDNLDACPDEPASTPDGCPIRDRDGDGKPDDVDKCPDEPSDLPDGCPDLDPDADGVLIPDDKCPDVPGVPPDGCPDQDPDRDGILGEADQCPDVPETKNGFEDADGCPDEVPEEVKKFTGVIKGIQFAFGKATIRATSFPLLDEAVKVLETYPSLRLRISGHTDSIGSDEANEKLSKARAQAVADYFVEKGIPEDRLETIGYGETKPVADNDTPAGRQDNRRIEFEVIREE